LSHRFNLEELFLFDDDRFSEKENLETKLAGATFLCGSTLNLSAFIFPALQRRNRQVAHRLMGSLSAHSLTDETTR
jgi:hypothetical protein